MLFRSCSTLWPCVLPSHPSNPQPASISHHVPSSSIHALYPTNFNSAFRTSFNHPPSVDVNLNVTPYGPSLHIPHPTNITSTPGPTTHQIHNISNPTTGQPDIPLINATPVHSVNALAIHTVPSPLPNALPNQVINPHRVHFLDVPPVHRSTPPSAPHRTPSVHHIHGSLPSPFSEDQQPSATHNLPPPPYIQPRSTNHSSGLTSPRTSDSLVPQDRTGVQHPLPTHTPPPTTHRRAVPTPEQPNRTVVEGENQSEEEEGESSEDEQDELGDLFGQF